MMQLRAGHLDAFEKAVENNFEERGVEHLRGTLAEATAPYSDGQLRQRITECVVRAPKYGLTTERHVMAFTDATYLAGNHFDTDPKCDWARSVLTTPGVSGDSKAVLLVAFAQLESNGRSAGRNPA